MNTMLAFLEINLLTGVGDSIELPKSKVLYVITGGQVRHGGGNEFPTGTFFMWQNISNPSAAAALRTKRPLLIATEIRTVVWSIPLNALSQIMKTSKEILEQKLVMLHNASSKTKKPAVAPSVADSFSSNKQDKTSTRAALSPSEPSESNSSFKLPSPCTFSSDQNSCIMPSNPRLEDFEFLDQVGDGAFSRVFVVRYRPSDGLYVLKQIDKKHLSHPKHNKQLNQEKQILMEVQNEPFVLHCYTAFEDQRAFYFVTEYIPGGELWTRIYESEMGYLSEFCARFYAANLLLALQGLHSRNIIYRDLKPENVMIDQCGYLKLVDLGFAKKLPHASITAGKDQRSKTLCGTHEYLVRSTPYI
jgi:tRNA A-37 threonylcarbamoyl transferase component Bud32